MMEAQNRSDALCSAPQEVAASINISRPSDTHILGNIRSTSASNSHAFISVQVPTLQYPMISFPLILLISIVLIAGTLRKFLRRCMQQQPNVFPASTGLPPCCVPYHPIYGHMLDVFSSPDSARFNSVFVDHANASGLSTLWFLNTPCIGVLKAEHAKFVFRNSIERTGATMISRHFKRALGQDSLVMLECGETSKELWRTHRSLIKVGFTKNAVNNMANKVWQVANGFTSSLLRECAKNDQGAKQGSYCAEAADIFKWVTLDIFGKVAFNYNFGCTDSLSTTPLAHSLNYTLEDSNTRCKAANLLNPAYQLYWLPTKRNRDYKHHSQNVQGLLREICQQRAQEIDNQKNVPDDHTNLPKKDDLLTILLKSKIESQGAKRDDTHDELVKMLLTLFFAGYDTSSVLLSMAMWSIATNLSIQKECAMEAQDASSTSSENEPSLHEDASHWESRLAYCRAVILETLRLHPPVPMNSRILNKDVKLDGCTIPKRTRVYLPITQIHTDERNFARPTEFLPERWVRRNATNNRWVARDYKTEPSFVENDLAYIPPGNPQNIFTFSDGARNCVGHRLALQESTMIFACVVRDLTVNVPKGLVMQKRKKFALAPPMEMPLIFRRREKQS
eukprot:CAMPEP_0196159064 /NCGR_PEP_ID=MMETSP0910-20130528/46130_1 /TAXON_ID=49265 /ORGANISM="Thalassiosira rotula, Strain GSO102" /LENGTH=620 /DNA_ID=CAMNT_0041423977 /DNA_START=233 /DNA_END=2095 /DNA_ORIENTATION=-